MDLALIISILAVAIQAGTSLVYATVGEIFTERSGILNLGVEGIMIMGAVTAFAAGYHTGSLAAALAVAVLVGGSLALIHAFLTVSLRADQVVSGLALTIFGTGLASFLGQRLGPEGKPLVGLVGPRFARWRSRAVRHSLDRPRAVQPGPHGLRHVLSWFRWRPTTSTARGRGCTCGPWARTRARPTRWASASTAAATCTRSLAACWSRWAARISAWPTRLAGPRA